MTREPRSSQRTSTRKKRTSVASRKSKSPSIHLPQSWRTVTSRKLRGNAAEQSGDAPRREVPEIRLSGAWLARVGFPKGRRYLISADREMETIYLQADVSTERRGRRGR